jgi:F-box and leucine-rich repeat protein 14
MTKTGAPRWRKTDDGEIDPALVYGLGDLRTLAPLTPAITVKDNAVYDGDLPTLARFTDLQFLDLGECHGISDAGLQHLKGLKNLKSLILSGEVLTGSGFSQLHELTALKSLTIYSSKGLTDNAIAELAQMKQLTSLHLHWASGLTDAQLAQLSTLTGLRELHIWGSEKITDIGLLHISKLVNLEALTFSHSPNITANGIAHLTALKNLQDISMGDMPLHDDAIQPLLQIQSLEYVQLDGLEITDQGIQSLSNLSRLKRLYLYRCRSVTADGVNKLKASLKGEYVLE